MFHELGADVQELLRIRAEIAAVLDEVDAVIAALAVAPRG